MEFHLNFKSPNGSTIKRNSYGIVYWNLTIKDVFLMLKRRRRLRIECWFENFKEVMEMYPKVPDALWLEVNHYFNQDMGDSININ